MEAEYDVIILGAGAAGLAAGLYTTRAMMKTLILESIGPGGQLLITDEICTGQLKVRSSGRLRPMRTTSDLSS